MKLINSILSIALAGSFMICTPVVAQEIVAHRGASYLAPENTLASVKLAFELGADAVEIDVHLSKDKRIMVNHDKNTKRTAGGIDMNLKDTDSEELRKLDVGSWKDQKFKGEKMPFLEEVLRKVPGGRKLVIEVKSSPEILPYLQQLISESEIQERLVIISFDKEVIVQAKQRMPAIPAYWLLHNFENYTLPEAIKLAKEHKLNGFDVYYKLVDRDFKQKMEQAGLEVWVYTVNDPEIARKLTKLGVHGITTDRPKWLKNELQP